MFKELDGTKGVININATMVKGNLYKVSDVEVGSWSTALFLEGFGSKSFNSVCFEVV